jgi:hypothetical protein
MGKRSIDLPKLTVLGIWGKLKESIIVRFLQQIQLKFKEIYEKKTARQI